MQITLSQNAGFCPGVRRADEGIKALISSAGKNETIYTLGELIHNRIYNEQLAEMGVTSIELSEVQKIVDKKGHKKITFVIRTHGIPMEDEQYLRKIADKNVGVNIIDMTCPYVKKIHRIAEDETGDNTFFLLFGSHTHPESIGIISHARGEKAIFTSEEELKTIEIKDKVPILCSQTTQNLLHFE